MPLGQETTKHMVSKVVAAVLGTALAISYSPGWLHIEYSKGEVSIDAIFIFSDIVLFIYCTLVPGTSHIAPGPYALSAAGTACCQYAAVPVSRRMAPLLSHIEHSPIHHGCSE
ncbi:hypothetical protein DL89DRAFT_42272 [Linderina pennispora]|uniref:Uncharacterized protein n=1 Tax=Linderina pennispora TaxID=61395 RepID=A0A1Y1VSF2_9FUNG|nr:uncharacterized protein DL89DRAFT_42272 [Linderina pennispora]ORX64221.1 hypothetical protein DL89DRAFT_42272 [Linderina pennispora]